MLLVVRTIASVIGRTFAEPVLRAVAGDAELISSLRTLERMGLISETARIPDREYAFRHSLTQDATYGTILLRRRRELHQRVGEVFEERYANRLDEFAPVDHKAPTVDGVVTAVGAKDLLEISIGSDDGLRKGHTLEVYRANSYLGRVIVRETWPDRAVVQIIPEYRKGMIKKGDRVATKLG